VKRPVGSKEANARSIARKRLVCIPRSKRYLGVAAPKAREGRLSRVGASFVFGWRLVVPAPGRRPFHPGISPAGLERALARGQGGFQESCASRSRSSSANGSPDRRAATLGKLWRQLGARPAAPGYNPRVGETIPVLVVSADPLARSGLSALVAASPPLVLAGEAGPREAARVEAGLRPRVVLWDLGGTAPSALGTGQWSGPGAPTVALVADPAQAGYALRAGAMAVISRGAGPKLIAAAVGCVVQGLMVLDPGLARSYVRAPEASGGAEPLTPREREVLALLAEGLANKAIAARLGISEHTAKFHVNAILSKLGVDSRAEAIVRAARLGLVVL